MKVAVIGAGPAGLSIARALKFRGIAYEQFERHSAIGGIWDQSNPGSPRYDSAHFISSRDCSGFFDFPMPKTFPDYPSGENILEYSRSFADAFDLKRGIQFGADVNSVEQLPTGKWQLKVNGKNKEFDAVIAATGVNWHAKLPRHEGNFSGEIIHSNEYRNPERFRGKRVLVVGLGNSGADIASDLAPVAAKTFVSVRRGYHFIPKHVFGVPADEFSEKGPTMPIWLERLLFTPLLRLLVGDVTRWGLPKPDHKLFESHPLLNSQFLHHLQHGNVKVQPDIDRFDGDKVLFKDGSSEQIDAVIYATGYDVKMPYLPEEYVDWAGGRPQMYMNAFPRQREGLYAVGFIETNSSAYTLIDYISNMVASHLDDKTKRPENYEAFQKMITNDHPDLSGGIKFIATDRHSNYTEINAYKKYARKLVKKMGWTKLKAGLFDSIMTPDGVAAKHALRDSTKKK